MSTGGHGVNVSDQAEVRRRLARRVVRVENLPPMTPLRRRRPPSNRSNEGDGRTGAELAPDAAVLLTAAALTAIVRGEHHIAGANPRFVDILRRVP